MKYLLFLLALQSLAYGKIEDFNSIINEDIRAQKELHQQVKKQVNPAFLGTQKQNLNVNDKSTAAKEIIVVENDQTNYTAPSGNNFLRFNKEIKQKSQNQRKNQHRVAKEIKELGF